MRQENENLTSHVSKEGRILLLVRSVVTFSDNKKKLAALFSSKHDVLGSILCIIQENCY